MTLLTGIAGIVAPLLLVLGLAAWNWRFVGPRALYVVIALVIMYGLQSLAIDPVMSYLLGAAPPASVEAAQSAAGCALVGSALVAGVIGVPLLRALALALRKREGAR